MCFLDCFKCYLRMLLCAPSFVSRNSILGLNLYINCDLFDDSSHHDSVECERCQNCHQTDRATRMMVGRPNKGPHFKTTHMGIGDFSLYEEYFDADEVRMICGSQGMYLLNFS